MNILIVASYLPYPLFSGGHIRLYNIIRELSCRHKITLVCEKRNYQTEKDEKEVTKFCQKIITVPRKKQWTLTNILKTGLSFYPFLVVGHTSLLMKQKIYDELKNDNYDLIHVETFYVMQNLPQTRLPIVLAEQNIEYLVYKRFADKSNFLLRALLYIDVAKIRYWEERFWNKANRIIAMSEQDRKIIAKTHVAVVPNGVDINKFRKLEVKSRKLEVKTILFIGDFRWVQNRDAVEWLIKDILPKINQEVRNKKLEARLRFWIVGKKIPDSIRNLSNNKNVIFDENAPDDTAEIFRKADLLVAPIRVGGGTKFKILEAMASGVPVVTTTVGIEGIETHSKQVLIADDAQGLADKTIAVLQNSALYKKVAENARKLIEEKYDWKIIVKKLEDLYLQIIH